MARSQRIKLKYIAKVQMGQSPPSADYTNEADGIPFLQGTAEFGDKYPVAKIFSSNPSKICNVGDILFSVRAQVGDINISNNQYGIGRGLCAIRGNSNATNDFLWWALHHERNQLKFVETGTTYSAVAAEDVGNLLISVFSEDEKIRINEFLNKQIAQIDNLISSKSKLLIHLSEKRQAFITQAVTKGIIPKVKMKKSGVDWLGDMPAHWELTKMKYLGEIFYGLSQPPVYKDEGTPLIRATNVYRGKIIKEGLVFVDENEIQSAKKIKLSFGDIIIVRSGAYTADSAIVTEQWEGSIAGFDMVLKPNKRVLPELLATILLSSYVLEYQLMPLRIRAAQPHLNSEELGGVFVLLPSIDEQKKINQYLKIELEKIELIINATKKSIQLLNERRLSIITAAVTGLIEIPTS